MTNRLKPLVFPPFHGAWPNKNKPFKKRRNIRKTPPIPPRGIIYVLKTRNNTLVTLADLAGNAKCWVSAGSLGLTGPRRATTYAGELTAEKLAKQALNLGYNRVIVKMKGLGYGKPQATKALSKAGLKITRIEDHTPTAHNGCRPPKKRRV
jgi:small subunit ribosomal protein S11